MKLTKEHKHAINEAFPVAHYTEATRRGAMWAIEKFGGIQWNKYPDTEPPEEGNYLVVDTEGTVVVWTWICKVKDQWGEITYWAEINLPNK